MTLISRLEKYCLTPAMAGFEDEMIKSLKADLSEYADEVRVDVLGNVIATIKGAKSSETSLMVFAHTDSLGMIVKRLKIMALSGLNVSVVCQSEFWQHLMWCYKPQLEK